MEKTVNPKSTLTHTALGVFKDEKIGVWYVAEIKYNPTTNQVGEINKVEAGPMRDFAIEKFKLEAVEHNLVG